ncbi:54S ribosomal protein L36, mitochondrial [Blastocladiella emersonii ATCC 22665]|nr:54S ribosomal protein L36, mitochondrial [Blastocladiella emersonii ATCC 22665]
MAEAMSSFLLTSAFRAAAAATTARLARSAITTAAVSATRGPSAIALASASKQGLIKVEGVREYQVRASIKPRCEHCYGVVRKGRRYILCKKDPKHKQRQG